MVGRFTPVRAVALLGPTWAKEFYGRLGDPSLPFGNGPKGRNHRCRRVGPYVRNRFCRTWLPYGHLRERDRATNDVRRGCGGLVSVRRRAGKKSHPLGTRDLQGAR